MNFSPGSGKKKNNVLYNTNGKMSCYVKCSKYYIDDNPLVLAQFLNTKAAGVSNDNIII